MQEPAISVVLTVHCAQPWLREEVLRLVARMRACDEPFEILILDHASPDQTAVVGIELAREIPLVSLFQVPNLMSQRTLLELGLANCRGAWVMVASEYLRPVWNGFDQLLKLRSDPRVLMARSQSQSVRAYSPRQGAAGWLDAFHAANRPSRTEPCWQLIARQRLIELNQRTPTAQSSGRRNPTPSQRPTDWRSWQPSRRAG